MFTLSISIKAQSFESIRFKGENWYPPTNFRMSRKRDATPKQNSNLMGRIQYRMARVFIMVAVGMNQGLKYLLSLFVISPAIWVQQIIVGAELISSHMAGEGEMRKYGIERQDFYVLALQFIRKFLAQVFENIPKEYFLSDCVCLVESQKDNHRKYRKNYRNPYTTRPSFSNHTSTFQKNPIPSINPRPPSLHNPFIMTPRGGLRLFCQNKYLKLHRKRVDSMASRNRNDENTIYIEYCRSCDTHNWCTHHDEAKYHQTFLKFTEMMAHRMPEVEVIGNMVPINLIPFKIVENKYIDANTNKYVVYPQIGSFEVIFRGKVVFSKKETHTWPNLPTIVSKISHIVNPEYQSPTKKDQPPVQEDRQTSKVSNNNSFLDSEEDKKTHYKAQQKGFTLTDHFKMYRPKNTFQDKDWMTEKQESQASSRQISEMVRGQSRERSEKKSDKSVQTKKSSDIVGQTKLKQMLKHKGMISKEQGKKQMIIRLDSIEEQNIFEEAAQATQRTQQKNVKKNTRMKEIDEQINALDNKFKDFQTRVHDIQTRNKQFEMKPGSSNNEPDKNRFKQIIENKREQMERNLSTKKSKEEELKEAREKAFADKTNKLEQYLNYTQAEKNDKLHRIYGEWKLIKQFSSKNKKLIRGKERQAQQQDNDDSDSQSASKNYSRSQSPNSYGNIITFKPKNEKMLERKLKNIKNKKQHKYSSVQRYHHVSQLGKDTKNQTDQHFYNNRKFLKPNRPQIESEADINPPQHTFTRLIKKSVNTLSMNALKSLANNQSSNLPKIESEVNSVQNFSTTAKANINKINNRISNIQEKLKNHNSNGGFQPILQSPYADRDRNYSKKSQSQSSDQNVSMKKLNKIYNGNINGRSSNASGNTIKKNFSQDKLKNSNFAEVARPHTKKINEKQTFNQDTQQQKPHQSKRKQAKYIDATEEDPVVGEHSDKASSGNHNRLSKLTGISRKVSKSKQAQIRQSKQTEGRSSKKAANVKASKQGQPKQAARQRHTQQASPFNEEPGQRKALREKRSAQQLSHHQATSDPKRAFRQRKVQDHKDRRPIHEQEARDHSQINEQQQDFDQNEHQYEFHPHQARQAKPLQRKFKDWKESSPTKNLLKSKQLDKSPKQGINQKIRESDSKQTVVRSKKLRNNVLQQNQSIISSNHDDLHGKAQTQPVEEKKARSGQIKRNRLPKRSAHEDTLVTHDSKEKVSTRRGQIRNQYAEPKPYNSERTQQNEEGENSFNNESQHVREPSNRYSSQMQYQSAKNYDKSENSSKVVTEISEQKLRKTLGYFKVNELCYRGVKTSEQNRSGQTKLKQANQASLYETEQNNNESEEDELQQNAEDENQEENEEQSQSQESQFVREGRRHPEEPGQEKEDTEQGWKDRGEDYENEDQMLPQGMEEITSQKNERKNSLEQKLQKENEVAAQEQEENSNQKQEAHVFQSQKISNQPEFSKQEMARPQTTQEACNLTQENIRNENQSNRNTKEEAAIENHSNQIQVKQIGQQQIAQNTSQNAEQNNTYIAASEIVSKAQSTKKPKAKRPVTKKESSIDIELVVCKHYSQYLSSRISNQLSKIAEPVLGLGQKTNELQENSGSINQNEQRQQEKAVQNVLAIKQEKQVADFMSFEPSNQEKPLQQDGEEEYEQEEKQTQVNVQSALKQAQISEQAQVQTVQKSKKVKQLAEKTEEQPEQKNEKTVLNVPIVTGIQRIPISAPKTQAISNIDPQTIQKVTSASPSQPVAQNVQPLSKQSSAIQKQLPLQDNVYSESKAQAPSKSKYAEIGVQKELTLEVSIQTDSPIHEDRIITVRKPTLPSSQAEGKKSVRSQIATPQQDNVFNEFDGTIRNNYLNDTKSSFRPDRASKEPQRAKITQQILSDNKEKQMELFASVISGSDACISKEEGAVTKMSCVYPQGVFMSERSLEVEQVRTKFTKFSKALQILAERGEWILTRLFQDPKGLLQERAFGVWLCLNFQWECFIVDDCIQADEANQPLFTIHTGNQKWANVLEKAVARAVGGYKQLQKTTCSQIFTLLTGCNSISVKVKQDPSKNNKLLQLINECQRKNYIVHAQKSWQRSKDQKDSIYYVLSVRRSNSEEQALLEISQDGRESFWMRLSKFTQQFSRVEVLQLRVNHNFNHIDLGIGKDNQLTVVELAFNESGQGCVTLTYIDHVGPLTAYLYREEKSRVLKLVGQAREKQKSHLFFQCNFNEGRYYVFAQTKEKPARLAYYGQNSPSMQITEEIHNDGLKNEVAEYLPIRETKEKPVRREMQETWNDWKGKAPRLKDNFMQSRLRENFVEYILGQQTRHKERSHQQ